MEGRIVYIIWYYNAVASSSFVQYLWYGIIYQYLGT